MKYLLFALFPLLLVQSTSAAERPNFLLIVADDLCWRDLGYQGHPDVSTPNIDKLAEEGMRLDGMFNPAATCSPTRHALYTGLYPIRSGAFPNHTRAYEGTNSIFTYLKAMGYRVALQNKSHVGPAKSFPYELITGQDNFADTESFMQRDLSQPWLLSFCSSDPHSPWTRGPQGKYHPAKITVPPYMHDNEQTRLALSQYFAEVEKLDEQVGELMKLLATHEQEKNTVVLFVSEQGCSLPFGGKWTLYETGVKVSAVIRWPGVIAAGSKSDALIEYIDVPPTFIELAGGKANEIDTGCPDANSNRGFDGRSFVSVLKGEATVFRQLVFSQHTTVGVNGFKQPYPSRMVRDDRYKLIRNLSPENVFQIDGIHLGQPYDSWVEDAKSDPALAARVEWLSKRPGEELYDLENDPFELTNLAMKSEYAEVKTRLQQQLDDWMQQQGDKGLETEMLAPTRQAKGMREEPEDAPTKKKRKAKAGV
jgi:N-sulfoglucosamine sulfohydrolase